MKENKHADACVLLLAAGTGTRSGLEFNKVLHNFGKLTSLEHCLTTLSKLGITNVLVAANENDINEINKLAAPFDACVYEGGKTRAHSVRRGFSALNALNIMPKIIVIHDAARPFAACELFTACIESAKKHGSGVAALPAQNTIYNIKEQYHPKRSDLFELQTPQAFDFIALHNAYFLNEEDYTDDSSAYTASGGKLTLVEGAPHNVKITTPNHIFGALTSNFCIGVGYDVHALAKNRSLILGGVNIPFELGLIGHSDADVLTHAVMDALLSAASLKDIGHYFPPTDEAYKNISSLQLLKQVHELLKQKNMRPHSISAVIMCQKPRLAPYIDSMCANIASALQCSPAIISISVTTTEELGIIGEGKGMAASATCLLQNTSN